MPASLYWHQNVYVFDQAVILPFALTVLLESLRGATASWLPKQRIDFLQSVTFFLGALTDWLFIFVALCVYGVRVLAGDLGASTRTFLWRTTRFWLPVALALSFFFYQLESFGGWSELIQTGLRRAAIGQELRHDYGGPADFTTQFWKRYMVDAYGKEGVFLLGISLVLFLAGLFCLVRPRGRRLDVGGRLTLGLMGITILPCLLQVYVLRQHSLQHSFSALKFSVPLSLIPFVALPVLIDRVLQGRLFALAKIPLALSTRRVGRAPSISVAALVVVVTGALYVTMNHKRHYEYFPDPSPELMEIGYFVRDNTEYRDIVFSSSFEIPVEPPQQLSYSRKRVYQALTLDDIYRKVTPLDELDRDYTINLLVFKDDQDLSAGMRNLISKAHKTDRSGSLRLFKIEPEVFRSVILESDSELSLVSPQTNDEYSLVQSEDGIFGELIRGSTGEIIRIVAGAMDGAVDMVQQERGHTWLRGWVSDEAHRETADRVLVFVDGKSNHEKHGSFRRIDLAPSLKKAGFHVGLPQPVFEEDPAPVVRVFAVSPTGTASELWYQPEYYDGLQKHRLGKAARALRYSLGRSGDGFEESIVSKTGKTVRVVPGAMDGAVDALSQQREHTRVSGWASDGAHRTPADQVAVFVNGEADHYGYTVVRRPDLVEGFKTKVFTGSGLGGYPAGVGLRPRAVPHGAGLRYLGNRLGF